MYQIFVNGNVVATFDREVDALRFFDGFTERGGRDCMLLLDPGVPREGFVVDTAWESGAPGTSKVYFSASDADNARAEFIGTKGGVSGTCVFARVRLLRLTEMSAVHRDDEGDFMWDPVRENERVTFGTW